MTQALQTQAIEIIPISDWQPDVDTAMSEQCALALEQGKVLHLPVGFAMRDEEQIFYSDEWLSGKRKNISLEGKVVRGATGSPELLNLLGDMIGRYAAQSASLINKLFPRYTQHLNQARTSFRPGKVEGPPPSWKKDDSRLHVDAFPSRPNHGERILRVFTNVNPAGLPRIWRVGEPFEEAALRFLPEIPAPLPGLAGLLHMLKITKSCRSEYDHIMLHLHDRMKADLDYQENAPQQLVDFMPGSTWICFSDQVLHAAMSGQFMFEQTFHLPISGQYHPELSPLRVLEQLTKRPLVTA
ncbi:MAG TPA: Kdo hydroxylase family protein [Methylophilaceae bacterium]|jgi:hypothetical protein